MSSAPHYLQTRCEELKLKNVIIPDNYDIKLHTKFELPNLFSNLLLLSKQLNKSIEVSSYLVEDS